MLEAIFPSGIDEITVDGLTQWDKGQVLRVDFPDMPTMYEVHFAFKGGTEALIVHVLDGATSNDVEIPNILLQQPYDLVAYVYLVGSDGSGETVKTVHLPLEPRPKPEDYTDELTPTQAERIDAMLAEIHAQANHAVETAEDAKAKAESAVNTANTAATTATNAQVAAANSATEAANSATAANNALEAASSAQVAAASSATDASNAQRAAEEAENAAKQTAADWDAENAALVQYENNAFTTVGGTAISLVEVVTRTGTGTYGSANPCSVTFPIVPKLVFVFGANGGENTFFYYGNKSSVYMPLLSTSYKEIFSAAVSSNWYYTYMKRSSDGKTLYWYSTNQSGYETPTAQLNESGTKYYFVAIG